MRWQRVDPSQITIIDGNHKEGYYIEVLSPRGALMHGPRGIDEWVVERCCADYGFKPVAEIERRDPH